MKQRPRPTREPIFDRIMQERVQLSAAVIGSLTFITYYWLLGRGWSLGEARNSALLLMVLFENLQVFNVRSELRSAFSFRHGPLKNPFLFLGTLGAQILDYGDLQSG